MHVNHAILAPHQMDALPRNEKVRGSSRLSSTHPNIALTSSFDCLAGLGELLLYSRLCPRVAIVRFLRPGRAASEKVRHGRLAVRLGWILVHSAIDDCHDM
jgi:hypothetical protein